MSEEKFTKGDWVIQEGDTFVDGSNIASELREGMIPIVEVKYAYLDDEEMTEIETEQLANAHLISAAPQMYRMLETLINRYPNSPHIQDPVIKLLAKARGEHEP